MEMTENFVFQADAPVVLKEYNNSNNYLIEFTPGVEKTYCALYFSSHYIYNPNNEESFTRDVIRKNKYEWYGTRIPYVHKHIFLRDLIKQWYLTGINGKINSPESLLNFLEKETNGYKIITMGSSAGGFASVLYGQLLKAEMILTFNGQFEINSQLKTSTPIIDPIVFRNQHIPELREYYDTRNFITSPQKIHYFFSKRSDWDAEQHNHVADLNMYKTAFLTAHHGVPFLKSNLPAILKQKKSSLEKFGGKTYHPLIFSFLQVGLITTFSSVFSTILTVLKRYFPKNKST
jgi:hypothetical protein